MNGLQILGTGRALPEHVVTNDDLAKIVDTSDEWIVSRTGIKERRFAREGENLTQFAVEAARQAIARAGIRPEDLGLCLMGTVTSDNATPAQSCLVHQALRLPDDPLRALNMATALAQRNLDELALDAPPKCIELRRAEQEEPLLRAVGDIDIESMNENLIRHKGGFEDGEDL